MVITVGGLKGGSGKSTLATNLAAMHAVRGHSVLLVDADEQGTAFDFTERRAQSLPGGAGFACVKSHGRAVLALLREAATKYEAVVVDVGGRDTASQRASLLASDVAVLPFLARPYDLWTLEALTGLLGEVCEVNTGLIAMSYISRADHKGSLMDEARFMLVDISPTLLYSNLQLGNRLAFAYASGQGLAVDELRPRDRKATDEINALRSYILDVAQESIAKRKGLSNVVAS